MSSRTGRRPASALPALHSFQFGSIFKLNNAVDLAIWMSMVLATVFFLCGCQLVDDGHMIRPTFDSM